MIWASGGSLASSDRKNAAVSSERFKISATGIGPGGFSVGAGLGVTAGVLGVETPGAGAFGAGAPTAWTQAIDTRPRDTATLRIHAAAGFLRDSS
jgi:hypothetical protein